MKPHQSSKAGPLDLTFTAQLRQETGKGGWTYVVMEGPPRSSPTADWSKSAGTIDDAPFHQLVHGPRRRHPQTSCQGRHPPPPRQAGKATPSRSISDQRLPHPTPRRNQGNSSVRPGL